jgi:MSHA biogenesis protein MshJ
MNGMLDLLGTRYLMLSRRQRGVTLVAALVLIAGLGEMALVEPVLREREHLLEVIAGETDAREHAQQRVAALQQPVSNAALRSQLDLLQAQLAGTDKEFDRLQSGLMQPQHMGALLQSLLNEQRGLQLIGLRSLPVTAIGDAAPIAARRVAVAAGAAASGTPADAPVATPPASDDGWLYRHAVEVRVQGSYADMVDYLQAIESFPRRVHWGELEIDASNYPANVMTVTIYTVSLEKSWWVL